MGSIAASGLNLSANDRRVALGSETITDAPLALATTMCRQPMGPVPITTTVSPNRVPAQSWQAITEQLGSARLPSANDMPSGMRCTIPLTRTSSDRTSFSASPPGNSGLMPTNRRLSQRL